MKNILLLLLLFTHCTIAISQEPVLLGEVFDGREIKDRTFKKAVVDKDGNLDVYFLFYYGQKNNLLGSILGAKRKEKPDPSLCYFKINQDLEIIDSDYVIFLEKMPGKTEFVGAHMLTNEEVAPAEKYQLYESLPEIFPSFKKLLKEDVIDMPEKKLIDRYVKSYIDYGGDGKVEEFKKKMFKKGTSRYYLYESTEEKQKIKETYKGYTKNTYWKSMGKDGYSDICTGDFYNLHAYKIKKDDTKKDEEYYQQEIICLDSLGQEKFSIALNHEMAMKLDEILVDVYSDSKDNRNDQLNHLLFILKEEKKKRNVRERNKEMRHAWIINTKGDILANYSYEQKKNIADRLFYNAQYSELHNENGKLIMYTLSEDGLLSSGEITLPTPYQISNKGYYSGIQTLQLKDGSLIGVANIVDMGARKGHLLFFLNHKHELINSVVIDARKLDTKLDDSEYKFFETNADTVDLMISYPYGPADIKGQIPRYVCQIDIPIKELKEKSFLPPESDDYSPYLYVMKDKDRNFQLGLYEKDGNFYVCKTNILGKK